MPGAFYRQQSICLSFVFDPRLAVLSICLIHDTSIRHPASSHPTKTARPLHSHHRNKWPATKHSSLHILPLAYAQLWHSRRIFLGIPHSTRPPIHLYTHYRRRRQMGAKTCSRLPAFLLPGPNPLKSRRIYVSTAVTAKSDSHAASHSTWPCSKPNTETTLCPSSSSPTLDSTTAGNHPDTGPVSYKHHDERRPESF